MLKTGAHCFAYETLEVGNTLPLLTPMSEVAGRMAIQAGAQWPREALRRPGILLGGVPGVERATCGDPRRRRGRHQRGAHGLRAWAPTCA
jgi:alanine dehydrogenase